MNDKTKKYGMNNVSLKTVAGTLGILLVGSNIFSLVGASEGEQVNCKALEFNQIQTPRASGIVNYTQMALDFVQENYPNKTLRILTLDEEYIPFIETGYVYADIKVEITPGASSPHDAIIVTIRHDTQNMEFGDGQYQRDYDGYHNTVPTFYEKLSAPLKTIIASEIGPLFPQMPPSYVTFKVSFLISKIDMSQMSAKMKKIPLTIEDYIADQSDSVLIGATVNICKLPAPKGTGVYVGCSDAESVQ